MKPRRRSLLAVVMLALISPTIEARENAPGDEKLLGTQLTQAARSRDLNGFLTLLTAGTRHAMEEAAAAQSELVAARTAFYAALDERFGPGGKVGVGVRFPLKDAAEALSKLENVEVLSSTRASSSRALLRVKTTLREPGGRSQIEEDSLPAFLEKGLWKLDLADRYGSLARTEKQTADVYRRVTQEVKSGALKTRISAGAEIQRARRSYAAKGGLQ